MKRRRKLRVVVVVIAAGFLMASHAAMDATTLTLSVVILSVLMWEVAHVVIHLHPLEHPTEDEDQP